MTIKRPDGWGNPTSLGATDVRSMGNVFAEQFEVLVNDPGSKPVLLRYYGRLVADPAADPLNNNRVVGDLYWNTVDAQLRAWNGTSWEAGSATTAWVVAQLAALHGAITGEWTAADAVLEAEIVLKADITALNAVDAAAVHKTGAESIAGIKTFTDSVVGVTKAMVGLDQVDNTSDVNKPVSTAQAASIGAVSSAVTALDAAAVHKTGNESIAGVKTFTDPVVGITKAMVGLGSVDNTSDAVKPVSTAQAAAIALRYGQNNVLGAVSQSGGVPTGAVIETGTNANGSWVKWANGTMICTGLYRSETQTNIAYGAVFADSGFIWTFPQTFTAVPAISGSMDDAVNVGCWLIATSPPAPSGSAVKLAALNPVSTANVSRFTLVAVGRWF